MKETVLEMEPNRKKEEQGTAKAAGP